MTHGILWAQLRVTSEWKLHIFKKSGFVI